MTAPAAPVVRMIDGSQRRAARVIGALYVSLMAVGVFAQLYVPGQILVPGDAAATAGNVVEHETLFRLSIVGDMICFAGDAALAVAYFVLLRPVSRGLAALGAFWRLAQATMLFGFTLTSLVALRLLGGADEVNGLSEAQRESLSWLALDAHAVGLSVGFILLGLGSTVFSYLLLRSGYVPKLLAGWGIFASIVITIGSLLIVAVPAAKSFVDPALYVPIFLFEVGTGLWLLIRGVR
jgi:hypothetical protein